MLIELLQTGRGRVGTAGRGKSREIPRFLPGSLGRDYNLEGQMIYSPPLPWQLHLLLETVAQPRTAQPWAGWVLTAHSQKEGLE